MTLIVSLVSNKLIQQAADRLVTKGGREYDAAANKALLYLAADAVVAIGYTGPAYLAGVPTDESIARALLGETDLPTDAIRVTLGGPRTAPDIGLAVRRVVERTASAFQADRRLHRERFEITIVGWHWRTRGRRGPVKTLTWKTKHLFDGAMFHGHVMPPAGGQVLLDATPSGWVDHGDMSTTLDEIIAAGPAPEATEGAITRFMRRTADRHAEMIGQDLQVISLPRPRNTDSGLGEIRVSARPDPARSPADAARFTGYSPWLIGPKLLVRPSLITGSFRMGFGPFKLVAEGSPNPHGASIHPQPRRRG